MQRSGKSSRAFQSFRGRRDANASKWDQPHLGVHFVATIVHYTTALRLFNYDLMLIRDQDDLIVMAQCHLSSIRLRLVHFHPEKLIDSPAVAPCPDRPSSPKWQDLVRVTSSLCDNFFPLSLLKPLDIVSAYGMCARICSHAPEANDMSLVDCVHQESWAALLVKQS